MQDFYFSHTYDLTSSIQTNVAVGGKAPNIDTNITQSTDDTGESKRTKTSRFDIVLDETTKALGSSMFSWNHHLLEPVSNLMDKRWCIPVMHGYFEQKAISLLGRTVHITVVSRRSRLFAGTRYLKRGVSGTGDVANEVETEQIVWEERCEFTRESCGSLAIWAPCVCLLPLN